MARTIKTIRDNKKNKLVEITTKTAGQQDIQVQNAITKETSQTGKTKQILDTITKIGQAMGKIGLLASVTGIGTSVGLSIAALGQSIVTVTNIAQAVLAWESGDKISGSLYLIKAAPGLGLLKDMKIINEKNKWQIVNLLLTNQKAKTFSNQVSAKFTKLLSAKPILKDIADLSSAILSGNVQQISSILGTSVQEIQSQINSQPAQAAQPAAQTTNAPAVVTPTTVQEHRKIMKAKRSKKLSDLYLS